MAAETMTLPTEITLPSTVAIEALALLNAYATVVSDFRVDLELDPFFTLEDPVWRTLTEALGRDPETDLAGQAWYDAVQARSDTLEAEIREHLDGPALAAITATKMAHDISEIKTRLEWRPRNA